MRHLLDTHAFLWLAADDPRLAETVRTRFADIGHEWYLSAASIWEMAVKSSLGKLTLATTLAQLVQGGLERGIRLLDVRGAHAFAVEHLPFHHRDPFDRLLIAQAMHEGMLLVSRDAELDAYVVPRVWD